MLRHAQEDPAALLADPLPDILDIRVIKARGAKPRARKGASRPELRRNRLHGRVLVRKVHHVGCKGQIHAPGRQVVGDFDWRGAIAEAVSSEVRLGQLDVFRHDVGDNDVGELGP